MFGIIYITVNKVNGRKYIGQHKCKTDNDSYLGSGKALLSAIKKYGRDNFERHTLYKAETEEELDQKEVEFISAFMATEREQYYNINEGGSANRMCGKNNPMYGKKGSLAPGYGRKKSDEEIKILKERMSGTSNPMFGRRYTEEEKRQIGDRQRGEKHWNYGRHWSEEAKKVMSEKHKGLPSSQKGIKRTDEQKRKISESKKGKPSNMSSEDIEAARMRIANYNKTEEARKKVSDSNKKYHEAGGRRGGRPVVCVETGIVYASCYDASRAIGCGLSSISACLCGSCKTVKGFHWRYATPDECLGELVVVA